MESYTALSTFQSETPASFSTPVLHHLQADCKVLVSNDQASLIPIFGAKTAGDDVGELSVEGIDLWVTNEYASSSSSSIPPTELTRPLYSPGT